MFHLTGIQYHTDNTNVNISQIDGDKNTVMARLHQEIAYMYASDLLKGVAILIVDDDLNTVKRTQVFKLEGDADAQKIEFMGVQYLADGTYIMIPTGGYDSLNTALSRYHNEMCSMYGSDQLRGCGVKIFKDSLEDILNVTEFKEITD